jgi:hypothetical protein
VNVLGQQHQGCTCSGYSVHKPGFELLTRCDPFPQTAEFVWNAFRMLDKLRRKQEISELKHKATNKHSQHTETYGFLVFTMVRDTR